MPGAFPARLQALRLNRGLTMVTLARQLGVSIPTLWSWEAGRNKPRADNMRALADALNVSPEYLRNGTGLAGEAKGDSPPGDWALPGYIEEAKQHIAHLAGVQPEQITINIRY